VTVQANSMSELPRALPPRVRELAAPLVGAASTSTSTSTTTSSSSSSSFNPWPWVLVGSGAVAIAGGAFIEATSTVSQNGQLDLRDVASPALWVVGAGAVIAGGVMFFSAGATNAP
jgi:hypothetical protein